MLNMRQYTDRLIFNMEIPIPVRWGPAYTNGLQSEQPNLAIFPLTVSDQCQANKHNSPKLLLNYGLIAYRVANGLFKSLFLTYLICL